VLSYHFEKKNLSQLDEHLFEQNQTDTKIEVVKLMDFDRRF
jgi:hypothetical protein